MDSVFTVTACDDYDNTDWCNFVYTDIETAKRILEYGKKNLPNLSWRIDRLYAFDEEYAMYHIDGLAKELFSEQK